MAAEDIADGGLSYACGQAQPALLEMTIGANLAATAAAHPDREALVDVPAGRRWSYAELLVDVRKLATGLLDAGVRTGDRVGIWAPNCAEWVLTQYATAEIGAVLAALTEHGWAHEGTVVVVERRTNGVPLTWPASWRPWRPRGYGDTRLEMAEVG